MKYNQYSCVSTPHSDTIFLVKSLLPNYAVLPYYCQPTAQIAAELGLSPRAVEGRLYRLRRKLRAYLEGGERDE